MPSPQPNGKTQSHERPTYNEMLWEQLQDTKNEVRETRKELNQRMDRLEVRMDKLEEKIDKLADKIDSFRNHGQIVTISAIGIALGVLCTLFLK